MKLQTDETTQWVAMFNTGISLLESLIKTQRKETDKKLEAIRTSLSTQESTAKAEEKAKLPGALEVTLTHKAEPKKIRYFAGQGGACEIPRSSVVEAEYRFRSTFAISADAFGPSADHRESYRSCS